MKLSRNLLLPWILLPCSLPLAVAQNNQPGPDSAAQPAAPSPAPLAVVPAANSRKPAYNYCPYEQAKNSCSFTALNGDCTITIDRLRPTAPATINARRGSNITVLVLHPSPFEDLSLDLKSATSIVPTDPLQAGFATITSNFSKFTATTAVAPAITVKVFRVQVPEKTKILERQNALFDALKPSFVKLKDSLDQIKAAVQPPPGDVCYGSDPEPIKAQAWLAVEAQEVVPIQTCAGSGCL